MLLNMLTVMTRGNTASELFNSASYTLQRKPEITQETCSKTCKASPSLSLSLIYRELLNIAVWLSEDFHSTSIGSAWLWSVRDIQQGPNRKGMFSWWAFARRERWHVCFPSQLCKSLFQTTPFTVAVWSIQRKLWHRLFEARTLRL